jgi:hypothetical protein
MTADGYDRVGCAYKRNKRDVLLERAHITESLSLPKKDQALVVARHDICSRTESYLNGLNFALPSGAGGCEQ